MVGEIIESNGLENRDIQDMSVKQRIVRFLFDRYFRWRLIDLMAPAYPIFLEYPISPMPRYGFGKAPHRLLYDIFNSQREQYKTQLQSFLEFTDLLCNIASKSGAIPRASDPNFTNSYFTGLDAIALMGFLRAYKPALLFEIGSGNSTKFARRAIRHFDLPTRIVSCDPAPRAEIDGISDEVLRQPAETLAPSIFEKISAGDILFIDSSHRVFQNSDVTMLFLEVIPNLKKNVIVHVHDILLPYDYLPQWSSRLYSEQYMLAMALLANPTRFEILLPNAFLSKDRELMNVLEPLWTYPEMRLMRQHALSLMHGFLGYSLWFKIA